MTEQDAKTTPAAENGDTNDLTPSDNKPDGEAEQQQPTPAFSSSSANSSDDDFSKESGSRATGGENHKQ